MTRIIVCRSRGFKRPLASKGSGRLRGAALAPAADHGGGVLPFDGDPVVETAHLLIVECPLEALERVNNELGTTTVIITHNADIAGMADRVIHLSNGLISDIRANETKKAPHELHW